MHNGVNTINDVAVTHFDRKLAATIKAPRRKIDGTDNRSLSVRQQELGMQLQTLQFMHFDSDVIHGAQASHSLHKFSLLKLAGRTYHDVNLDSAVVCSNQPFDNHSILVPFVLQPQ